MRKISEKYRNTLFVTDLDGTLLRRDQTVSEFSVTAINELIRRGMLFTYATARSAETAEKVTAGLNVSAPRVLYNGAFIRDIDGKLLVSHTLKEQGVEIVRDLISAGIYPIVYALIGGHEKFSFITDKQNRATAEFNETRKSCARYNPVADENELVKGDIFYITCIDESGKLESFYEKYRDEYYCVYQRDIYSGEQWLEIMPKAANKANALRELKAMLNCRLVVFGDGKNDIEMLDIADESYAVKNAVAELKSIATAVISDNESDGVAKFLLEIADNKN